MSAWMAGAMVSVSVAVTVAIAGAVPSALARMRTRRRLRAPGADHGSFVGRVVGGAARSGEPDARSSPWSWAHGWSTTAMTWWWAVGGAPGRRADRSLPLLLEAVARELRAGASVQGALVAATAETELGPARPDPATGVLAASLGRGTAVGEAVTTWVGSQPTPARHLAGAALIVAAQTGGATAVVIDGVADTLRDRVALEREVAALSSQARASAMLLVVAPVVVAVVVASAEPRITAFLLGSPVGWACVVCGLVLDAVGAAWIHLTIRRSS